MNTPSGLCLPMKGQCQATPPMSRLNAPRRSSCQVERAVGSLSRSRRRPTLLVAAVSCFLALRLRGNGRRTGSVPARGEPRMKPSNTAGWPRPDGTTALQHASRLIELGRLGPSPCAISLLRNGPERRSRSRRAASPGRRRAGQPRGYHDRDPQAEQVYARILEMEPTTFTRAGTRRIKQKDRVRRAPDSTPFILATDPDQGGVALNLTGWSSEHALSACVYVFTRYPCRVALYQPGGMRSACARSPS